MFGRVQLGVALLSSRTSGQTTAINLKGLYQLAAKAQKLGPASGWLPASSQRIDTT